MAHLLVLHGPHLERLGSGRGPLGRAPKLAELNATLELAAASARTSVRITQARTELELVDAVQASEGWATHVLLSPGALAPTAHLLREALALADLPFAEVFVDALPDAADHRKRSVLKDRARFQKLGPAGEVYLEAAQKLLGVKFAKGPFESVVAPPAPVAVAPPVRIAPRPPPPAPTRKELGPPRAHPAEPAPRAQVAKTLGRVARHAEPLSTAAARGPSRATVRQKIAQRLAGRLTAAELASWSREQWLALERGAAGEPGQRELLADVLQTLALSAATGATRSDSELLDLMARMG